MTVNVLSVLVAFLVAMGVLFQGVPWRVENIGISSTLVNPLLAGATTRITLEQLRALNGEPGVEQVLAANRT